jgi:1-acyl-sn-glycerol-3-phosphate acyltransferase
VLRAFISPIVFVIITIIGALMSLGLGLIDRSGDLVIRLARIWSMGVLGSAGVRVHVRWHAPLEVSRPYVFMPNHLSSIDIWAVFSAVPRPVRFIAKKQLGAIPLFGWAMRAGRFIFIDRQNPASARRTIEEAARRIRSGDSVVIFPEGTRSRDGRLGPFKKGGFHLAINSGAAIVPVAIHGSRPLMPRGSMLIRPGEVTVEFGEPIATEGLDDKDRNALVARVHGRIAEMLGEPAAPRPRDPDRAG